MPTTKQKRTNKTQNVSLTLAIVADAKGSKEMEQEQVGKVQTKQTHSARSTMVWMWPCCYIDGCECVVFLSLHLILSLVCIVFMCMWFRYKLNHRNKNWDGCYPFLHSTTVSLCVAGTHGIQEWVIQIPSIQNFVSFVYPSLHLRLKFLLVVKNCIVDAW